MKGKPSIIRSHGEAQSMRIERRAEQSKDAPTFFLNASSYGVILMYSSHGNHQAFGPQKGLPLWREPCVVSPNIDQSDDAVTAKKLENRPARVHLGVDLANMDAMLEISISRRAG